jgi:hypothetical protein
MQTLNTLLPVLYIITLILCGLSFTALFLTFFYSGLKAVKNFLF